MGFIDDLRFLQFMENTVQNLKAEAKKDGQPAYLITRKYWKVERLNGNRNSIRYSEATGAPGDITDRLSPNAPANLLLITPTELKAFLIIETEPSPGAIDGMHFLKACGFSCEVWVWSPTGTKKTVLE